MAFSESMSPRDWASYGSHPGIWFRDTFSELRSTEKAAWLELLTLAIASYPTGKVGFCSERQIARLFQLDESAFSSTLRKAQDHWLVEVSHKAVVPYFTEYDDRPVVPICDVLDNSKEGALYKEMTFPGIFRYYPDRQQCWFVEDGKQNSVVGQRDLLDAVLSEPLALLRERMRMARAGALSPDITNESPICWWANYVLPADTRMVEFNPSSKEPFNIREVIWEYKGLALWEGYRIIRTIGRAWEELETWMQKALTRPIKEGAFGIW